MSSLPSILSLSSLGSFVMGFSDIVEHSALSSLLEDGYEQKRQGHLSTILLSAIKSRIQRKNQIPSLHYT